MNILLEQYHHLNVLQLPFRQLVQTIRNYKVRRAQNTKHENWLIVLVSFPGSSLFSEVEREDPGNEVAAALRRLCGILKCQSAFYSFVFNQQLTVISCIASP